MIKKLRLSKPVGGGRPVVFPTRDTDGRKEIGERKTDRDRQDDQERQKGKDKKILGWCFSGNLLSKTVSLLFCKKGYDQARAVSTKL